MIKLYIGTVILIIGIAIGITGTMIVQQCDIEAAMKPLVEFDPIEKKCSRLSK